MDTRAAYVADWLGALAYTDFDNTIKLLTKAVDKTIQEKIKPSQLLELLALYDRPYQNYIRDYIRSVQGYTSTPPMAQVEAMKQLATYLFRGCNVALSEILSKPKKSSEKNILQAIFMAMTYRTHVMVYSFMGYSLPPPNIWRDLNSLYREAVALGKQHTQIKPLIKGDRTTIELVYKQAMLIFLSNPLHLPEGTIWGVYEQLNDWCKLVKLKWLSRLQPPNGCFVIDIARNSQPIAYNKFSRSEKNEKPMLLDANPLRELLKGRMENEDSHSTYAGKFNYSLLYMLEKAWTLPARRVFPRRASVDFLELAVGLESAYYYANDQQGITDSKEHITNILATSGDALKPKAKHVLESWGVRDRSDGGVAVINNKSPKNRMRVGWPVIMRSTKQKNSSWGLGIARWMMIQRSTVYRAGIQTISSNISPVIIRPYHSSGSEDKCALLIYDKAQKASIVCNVGVFSEGLKLKIVRNERIQAIETDMLIEAGIGFECFTFNEIKPSNYRGR